MKVLFFVSLFFIGVAAGSFLKTSVVAQGFSSHVEIAPMEFVSSGGNFRRGGGGSCGS